MSMHSSQKGEIKIMQTQNPITQQQFNEIVKAAIAGKSRGSMIKFLQQKGFPAQTAESVTARAFQIRKKLFQKQGIKFMLFGILMFAVGAAITGLSYFLSSPDSYGDSYITVSGFLVGGLIFFLLGLGKIIQSL